jgi:hypothetical protein
MLQLQTQVAPTQPLPRDTALTWLPIYHSVVVYRESPELILVDEQKTAFLFSAVVINNMTGMKVRDVHFMVNRPATFYYHKSKYENYYYVQEYSEYFRSLGCSCQESRQYNGCSHRRNVSDKTGLNA